MRSPLFLTAIALAVALLGVGDLFALEGPAAPHAADAPHAEGVAHADGGKLGFLQLSRWDLGLWTLVVFGLMFFILSAVAWKPIINGLDQREKTLVDIRAEAEAARAEAQALKASLQADLAKAAQEVRAMLDEARRDADAVKAEGKSAGAAEAKAELERARRDIQIARDEAMSDIYAQSVQLASLIASKAIQREVSAAAHQDLLNDAIQELSQTQVIL